MAGSGIICGSMEALSPQLTLFLTVTADIVLTFSGYPEME